MYTILSAGADDIFSPPVQLVRGAANISVWGSFVATVTIQRSFDGGQNWLDIDNYSGPAEMILDEPEGAALYRIGVKAGNYTSGTVMGRIGQ